VKGRHSRVVLNSVSTASLLHTSVHVSTGAMLVPVENVPRPPSVRLIQRMSIAAAQTYQLDTRQWSFVAFNKPAAYGTVCHLLCCTAIQFGQLALLRCFVTLWPSLRRVRFPITDQQ